MSPCSTCELVSCCCRSGQTIVAAAGSSAADAQVVAEGYLSRRGWKGELLGARRRRTRLGIMGYQAWDLKYRVTRA